ncbi:MAG: hypothetical protein KBD67_00280 [Anaerolineaceae bacterium]|nr:hypothetical protein [Anaerolineaceae bacterium]
MDNKKSHQWNFVFEALPALFHSQTDGFMKYIDTDGVKFLKFYWDHTGDKMPEEKRVSSPGLNYEKHTIDEKTQLVLITLPSPKEDGDAFFVGLIPKPERRFSIVRFYNSTMFVLLRKDDVDQPNRTSFGEVTPRGNYHERGVGLKPTKQDFIRIIKNRLEKKK